MDMDFIAFNSFLHNEQITQIQVKYIRQAQTYSIMAFYQPIIHFEWFDTGKIEISCKEFCQNKIHLAPCEVELYMTC